MRLLNISMMDPVTQQEALRGYLTVFLFFVAIISLVALAGYLTDKAEKNKNDK